LVDDNQYLFAFGNRLSAFRIFAGD